MSAHGWLHCELCVPSICAASTLITAARLSQGIPLKDKGQTDSYQRIEAPVRGGEGAAGKIPDGGPPVTERQNSLDRLLIQNDQAQVRVVYT